MSSPNLFLLGRRPGFEDQLTEMLVWLISAVPEVGGAIVQLAFADQDEAVKGLARQAETLPHPPATGTTARASMRHSRPPRSGHARASTIRSERAKRDARSSLGYGN